jgi:hypothetical protein
MRHPLAIAIPVLLLADYYLTLLGARLRKRAAAAGIEMEEYELNPLWQEDVNRGRAVSPRHLVVVLAGATLAVLIGVTHDLPAWRAECYLGLLLLPLSTIIGKHLSNLLTLGHAVRRPGEVTGDGRLSYRMALRTSQHEMLSIICPVAAVAASPTRPFALGGLLGLVFLLALHWAWLWLLGRRPIS